MMKVTDINGSYVAADVHELETLLWRRRENDINAFWLCHDTQEHPQLSILVNGDLAALHFIPSEQEAGFRSVGKMHALDSMGMTPFSISEYPGDDIEEPNESVVPFSIALSVAQEFFLSNALPKGVEWSEL